MAIGSNAASLVARGMGWCVAHMARSPMASTVLILVSGLTLIAGTNALFMQETRHPAPLFSAGAAGQTLRTPPQVQPVVVAPVERPQGLSMDTTTQTIAPEQPVVTRTASTDADATPAPERVDPASPAIGNADIAGMQEKLKALGLYDGTVDGYYGPKTADSIRAFEQRAGMPKTGAATPQVIEAVRNAPINTSQADATAIEPTPAVRPEGLAIEQAGIGALISDFEQPTPAQPEQTVAVVAPAPVQSAEPQPTIQPAEAATPPALDRELISDIQRGLARLGFMQGPVSGTADENTARAIRKFQIFNNYAANGEVSPQVHQMLVRAGAFM